MKKAVIGTAWLALVSGAACAEGHWFMGYEFGPSRGSNWSANVEDVKNEVPVLFPPFPSPVATSDGSSSAHMIYGGYRFGAFALEAFYGGLGEFTGTVRSPALLPHIGVDLKAEYKAYGLAAVGFLPVGEHFEFLGKIGVGSLAEKVTSSFTGGAGTTTASESSSATTILLGVGMAIKFGRGSAVTLHHQSFSFDRQGGGSESIKLTTVGLRHGF